MGTEAYAVYLLRWVPDPIRDEARNVGMLVFPETGPGVGRLEDWAPAFVRDFFETATREACDWQVENGWNSFQARRMTALASTAEEVLDREYGPLVGGPSGWEGMDRGE